MRSASTSPALRHVSDGGVEVDGVPADDGVGEERQALGLEILVVGSAVLEVPEVGEEQLATEGVE